MADPKVTPALLAAVGPKGKYLVGKLRAVHTQKGCVDVPAGTAGLILASRGKGDNVFCFPNSVLDLRPYSFSNGEIRIVALDELEILGRVG